jgi:hypothetical protein
MCNLPHLFSYERDALLRALRRDLHAEIVKCGSSEETEYHRYNVRLILRLLEAINPRNDSRAIYWERYERRQKRQTCTGHTEKVEACWSEP